MNERIRELLEEATEVYDNWKTGGSQRLVDHKIFAELIVRECAEVASCNGHVSGFALGDLIKQYFGVKEE